MIAFLTSQVLIIDEKDEAKAILSQTKMHRRAE